MNAQLINPFIAALSAVLPQLGFKNIVRGKLFPRDQFIDNQGILINVQVGNQISGNIAFTMSVESAKRFSSTMMRGTPVENLDSMAQSALCEIFNMVTSNAAMALKSEGFAVSVVPPALSQGTTKLKICNSNFIGVEMVIDELPIEVGIALN